MALKHTEEKLNSFDKETLIQLFLSQQEQLEQINHNLQLVLEQVADLKRHRFGKSSERHETEGQISFTEVDGKTVFFNESEAVAAEEPGENPEAIPHQKPKKKQGKREGDLKGPMSITQLSRAHNREQFHFRIHIFMDGCRAVMISPARQVTSFCGIHPRPCVHGKYPGFVTAPLLFWHNNPPSGFSDSYNKHSDRCRAAGATSASRKDHGCVNSFSQLHNIVFITILSSYFLQSIYRILFLLSLYPYMSYML